MENILTDLSADKKIGGNDEDPYVVQAKIAAENTRNRAEARKSQLSSKKSKFRAGALLVRKKGMNFADVTKSAPSSISNKKQENH